MKFLIAPVMILSLSLISSSLNAHEPVPTPTHGIYIYSPPPVQYMVVPQPTIMMVYPDYLMPQPWQPFRNIAKRHIRRDLYNQAVLDYRWRQYHNYLHGN